MTTAVLRVPRRLFQNLILNKNALSPSQSSFLTSSEKMGKGSSQSTIDAPNVQLFSSKMQDWWDLQGPMKGLHSFNLIRVPFVRDGLVPCVVGERTSIPLKDKKILDVGCGGGILSEALARLGAVVTGIDASPELITLADKHKNIDQEIASNKPTYFHSTIEDHTTKHMNHYDAVVASEVIEHINNKELFVKSCVEVLKPGGKIFVTTPNRTQLSNWLVIFAAENLLRIVPKGTHEYDKFITPNELTFLLDRNNCHVEVVYGTIYHFLINKWEFISSQQLMYALQAVKLN